MTPKPVRRGASRGLTVRPAADADIAIVTELRIALLGEHASNPIYRRLRADARTRARKLYLNQIRASDQVTLLAERRGTVVGILRCVHSIGYPILLPAAYGYVSSVYVRPEARRAGVLRALMDEAERWCRGRGLSEIRLHNAADNALSNATWDALGFDVVEHLRMRPLVPEAG
ncbi:MAG: GNAT family N-acetyltransferase [Gemmatimonadaceae bacterium]